MVGLETGGAVELVASLTGDHHDRAVGVHRHTLGRLQTGGRGASGTSGSPAVATTGRMRTP